MDVAVNKAIISNKEKNATWDLIERRFMGVKIDGCKIGELVLSGLGQTKGCVVTWVEVPINFLFFTT
jgi:hypothetical protein